MNKQPAIEHIVTIRIRKDSDDKPMTERQVQKWVEKHFAGCDYGTVRVTDSINMPVRDK